MKDIIEEYLEMSGQTFEELMAGEKAYGMHFIAMKLVPKAVSEKKKIVWKAGPGTGKASMTYTLEAI
jgi:hypothetical protein